MIGVFVTGTDTGVGKIGRRRLPCVRLAGWLLEAGADGHGYRR
jgi:hypothetical protein